MRVLAKLVWLIPILVGCGSSSGDSGGSASPDLSALKVSVGACATGDTGKCSIFIVAEFPDGSLPPGYHLAIKANPGPTAADTCDSTAVDVGEVDSFTMPLIPKNSTYSFRGCLLKDGAYSAGQSAVVSTPAA